LNTTTIKDYHIQPPNIEDVLSRAPEYVRELHEKEGLSLYREVISVPHSECKLVEEGYIERERLPNGQYLTRKKRVRLLSIEDATELS
jgi:hypothetical protein